MVAPILRLRHGTRTWILVPGGQKLLGRDPASDVVLGHPSVSRFHARVTWDEGKARPVIDDLHSVNGLFVDGTRVTKSELTDATPIGLGSVRLDVDLVEDRPPARLETQVTDVRLFSGLAAPDVASAFRTRDDLHRVLLDLEGRRRTGTLVIERSRGSGSSRALAARAPDVDRGDLGRLVLARGKIVDAVSGSKTGLPALLELLDRKDGGTLQFKLDFTPKECSLNVSFQQYLAMRTERRTSPPTQPMALPRRTA